MSPRRRVGDPGEERPVYMISVAAELSGMHPQTLRVYERRQLIRPKRSAGNTRLYSDADIERLRLIQHLTQVEGINLAGVERIMELEDQLAKIDAERERLRHALEDAKRGVAAEVEAVRRSYRSEIVLVPRGGIARMPRRREGDR